MKRAFQLLTRVRFRFSLRLFWLLFTGLIVWTGVKSNQVRRERDAVAVLTRYEIGLIYDYQHRAVGSVQRQDSIGMTPFQRAMGVTPTLPQWLADSAGKDYVQSVTAVEIGHFDEAHLQGISQALRDLPHLREIYLWGGGSCLNGYDDRHRICEKLRSEFPHIKFTRLYIDVVG